MRRAALSVPANIAEGYNRISIRDKIHFYIIAEGSLNELEYYIDFSLRLNYLNKNDQLQFMDLKKEVGRLLNGLIKSWRK